MADKHGRLTHTPDMAGCSFLVRGRTPCKNMRSSGTDFCHAHDPARLAAERASCVLPKGSRSQLHGAKELQRVSSSQARMFNPFSGSHERADLVLPSAEEWALIFANLSLPVMVDIGCARGKMLMELAESRPDMNFIGIEARDALVREANACVETTRGKGPSNIRFYSINMMDRGHLASFAASMQALPGAIALVSILFPDPWLRRRHRHRRLVQPPMLHVLEAIMASGALLLVASDVCNVVLEARAAVGAVPAFVDAGARRADEGCGEVAAGPEKAGAGPRGADEGCAGPEKAGAGPRAEAEAMAQELEGEENGDGDGVDSNDDGGRDCDGGAEHLVTGNTMERGTAASVAWARALADATAPRHDAAAAAVAAAFVSRLRVDAAGFVTENPLAPAASEREHVCEMFWRRVYRTVARKA